MNVAPRPAVAARAAAWCLAVLTLAAAPGATAQEVDANVKAVSAEVLVKFVDGQDGKYLYRNFQDYDFFPHARTLQQEDSAWEPYFEQVEGPTPSKGAGLLSMPAGKTRFGDIVVLDSPGMKPLVLFYNGESSFKGNGGRKHSFFTYPYMTRVEMNTFPPRLHRQYLAKFGRLGPLLEKAKLGKAKAVRFVHSEECEADFLASPPVNRSYYVKSRWWQPGATYRIFRIKETPTPTPTLTGQETAGQLAALIRDGGRITLLAQHVSGKSDRATARDNIADAAAGNDVKRSSYQNAPGGTVALEPEMLRGMVLLSQSYTFRVTEVAGGSHSGNSRHYAGIAFDVDRINDAPVAATNADVKTFMAACRKLGATEVLGPGDADHDTHVHAAWPRP